MITKITNYDFLLDKIEAEKLLNDNCGIIFGKNVDISILEIKRNTTYNKTSWNVWYRILVDHKEMKIRLSASTIFEKKRDYQILQYFYNHGFSQGEIVVSRPIALLEDQNIFMYEDANGKTFKEGIDDEIDVLKTKVEKAALVLKKIHALAKPDFDLWYTKLVFNVESKNTDNLSEFYGEYAEKIVDLVLKIKEKLKAQEKTVFCHGDFQPDNLIFDIEKIYVLDFSLACLADREYDLAHFVTQLGVMMNMYGDPRNFDDLKKYFLDAYGEYDQEKLALYSVLACYRVLEVYRQVNEKRYLDFVLKMLKNNLEKSNLE
ncbi:MAG: aminoglycoside phosphotransferase family protein [Candidatus Berkelbacteria bacterium]